MEFLRRFMKKNLYEYIENELNKNNTYFFHYKAYIMYNQFL